MKRWGNTYYNSQYIVAIYPEPPKYNCFEDPRVLTNLLHATVLNDILYTCTCTCTSNDNSADLMRFSQKMFPAVAIYNTRRPTRRGQPLGILLVTLDRG